MEYQFRWEKNKKTSYLVGELDCDLQVRYRNRIDLGRVAGINYTDYTDWSKWQDVPVIVREDAED